MPEIVTIYIPCSDPNVQISSSVVRELLKFGKNADRYVPAEIKGKLSAETKGKLSDEIKGKISNDVKS